MDLFIVSVQFSEKFHRLRLRAALVYGHKCLGGSLTASSFNKAKAVHSLGCLWPP